MKKSITALIFVALGLFIIHHSIEITSQINASQTTEPQIQSVSPESNISMAHITSPVTTPVIHEYKDDDFPPNNREIITEVPIPFSYFSYPPDHHHPMEICGFLTAKKYQSSYLV